MDLSAMADMTVDEVLQRWPQTIPIFLGRSMACVGCPLAAFETLADVAQAYNLELTPFLAQLQAASSQAGGAAHASQGGPDAPG
ncbi:DUF1858 domain-containing protein [Litorilinea aerophila]|uniref:DUF1858 domain-containing protein n=1 Tax=Litorilinea aerophila TaxID=1204385 RepID=A0A540VLT2_9CHLR|nr:DUF1858 domain-containing protein [Litorilinea aerophila]MCC9074950.1 DUF1858 domain-containing protein [Litorilinea aerophila]GIV76936.1 MAG: hypothetical protein KatS3mg050_1330 [Litorilinea sp.]